MSLQTSPTLFSFPDKFSLIASLQTPSLSARTEREHPKGLDLGSMHFFWPALAFREGPLRPANRNHFSEMILLMDS